MKSVFVAFCALIVFLESVQIGMGLAVLQFSAAILSMAFHNVPAGLGIALLLLLPAFLLGADWRAKAMLAEEKAKLEKRIAEWEIF